MGMRVSRAIKNRLGKNVLSRTVVHSGFAIGVSAGGGEIEGNLLEEGYLL
jgi:hypothetical protein